MEQELIRSNEMLSMQVMSGLVERHEKDIDEHKQLMGRLSDNVNRLSRI